MNKSAVVNRLPKEFYPDCWNDDERMDNLFAPFRAKSVNLVNYENKLLFWKELIKKYCTHNGNACFNIITLKNAFQRSDKKPYCLDTVIKEQLVDGTVRPKAMFALTPQQTWSGWAMNTFIKSPLQWSFNKVKERVVSPSDSPDLEEIDYVVIEVVQNHGKILLKHNNEGNENNCILSEQEFCHQYEEMQSLKPESVKLALCYLCNIGQASFRDTMIDNKSVRLYKLATSVGAKAVELSQLDASIYALRKMEKSLIKSVEGIETEMENTDGLVRRYLKENKKQLAKSFLRKKHVLAKNLNKTVSSLSTLQLLLMQIDETGHNAAVVDALKLGSTTLKAALEDKNITVDSVEDTLADVKEILDVNAEIQFALSGAQFNDIIGNNADDSVLEDELRDLLAEGSPAKNKETVPPVLPLKDTEPSINNVIDDLLEARLKNLTVDNGTFNVTIETKTDGRRNTNTNGLKN